MSEKEKGDGGREQLTRRSSFRKPLHETELPEEYLIRLEEKRRQLDESVHKYIAAKERDFKAFKKELWHQYRNAEGQDGSNGGPSRRRGSPESIQQAASWRESGEAVTTSSRRQADKGDAGEESGAHLDRAAVAGLKDRRASLERDKDFIGVFTPTFLPAINDQNLASSAPSAVTVVDRAEIKKPIHLERSNSDTLGQAKPKRPSHLALAHRTSSSGSSADGKLASAMKSPSQQSKRKRVSLAVGDSIVAPSDNVPAVPSNSNTPSHSRQRSAGGNKQPWTQELSGETADGKASSTASGWAQTPATSQGASSTGSMSTSNTPSASANTSNNGSTSSIGRQNTTTAPKLDPDGDLFDLEAVENVPFDQPDDLEEALETDDSEPTHPDPFDPPPESTLDPSTASIPISQPAPSTPASYVPFAPSSAVASQQPINPGFRRPSVVDDPVYREGDYEAAEEDAVENEIYGSSFNRPGKGSFTAGSLGESFMAKFAETRGKGQGVKS
ncbi:uncharacterized protein LTR77_001755 [Saxophila tyrrhenica]|uniref:Uncharacterized protein n=1 Tax=Saxophila tyrrhenica TaxID=1690608 RepID=A0AAV9PLC4_9PEZI|nr:hypothetical protein LTR77_001755 [Saxophila tyrrhenica]